jgi:hypothetical protein
MRVKGGAERLSPANPSMRYLLRVDALLMSEVWQDEYVSCGYHWQTLQTIEAMCFVQKSLPTLAPVLAPRRPSPLDHMCLLVPARSQVRDAFEITQHNAPSRCNGELSHLYR